MSKRQRIARGFGRTVKRLAKGVARLLVLAILLAVVGTAAVWSHFWGARVGNPSADSCGNCHIMQSYVDSLQASDMLASAHSAREITCTDCHDYGLEQQVQDTLAYLQNNYQQPLTRERISMDTCFKCHEHGSYDQIAWRTTDLGVTDAQAKGHSANPHQPPHYTNLECYSCHRVHSQSTLLCWECHNYEFPSPYMGIKPETTPTATPPGN